MNQWIIDRYNKGQDKRRAEIEYDNCPKDSEILITDKKGDFIAGISLYDFLFDPEWGFDEAFWGKDNAELPIFISNMAISDDPLKYLEQFKENV